MGEAGQFSLGMTILRSSRFLLLVYRLRGLRVPLCKTRRRNGPGRTATARARQRREATMVAAAFLSAAPQGFDLHGPAAEGAWSDRQPGACHVPLPTYL